MSTREQDLRGRLQGTDPRLERLRRRAAQVAGATPETPEPETGPDPRLDALRDRDPSLIQRGEVAIGRIGRAFVDRSPPPPAVPRIRPGAAMDRPATSTTPPIVQDTPQAALVGGQDLNRRPVAPARRSVPPAPRRPLPPR